MSPRRKVDSDAPVLLDAPEAPPSRRRLAWVAAAAAAMLTVALTVSTWVFVHAQGEHRAEIRQAAVLSFVRSFLTQYTSPDPFNANAYADRVLALGTGDFAKMYTERMNEIVVQVARAERGAGSVAELGIENWNDDGSANVVAVTTMTTTMPDGQKLDSGARWVVTAIKEGDQWKVSNLIQVL
jgi:Mce-associated membrane protein